MLQRENDFVDGILIEAYEGHTAVLLRAAEINFEIIELLQILI